MNDLRIIIAVLSVVCSLFIWAFYLSAVFYKKEKYSSKSSLNIGFHKDNSYFTHNGKYLAVIPAHNEESVIGESVGSLINAGFDTVAVACDSCSDNTKDRAFEKGALVFDVNFHNKDRSVKYIIEKIAEYRDFDGLFIFDADNVVDKDFLKNAYSYLDNNIVQFRYKNKNNREIISRLSAFMNSMSFAFQRGMMVLVDFGIFFGSNMYFKFNEHLRNFCEYSATSVLDDYENTLHLFNVGEHVTFIDDQNVLCYNESPENLIVSFNQRLRWARGHIFLLFKKFKMFSFSPAFLAFSISNLLFVFSVVFIFLNPFDYLIFSMLFCVPLLIFINSPDYITLIDILSMPLFFLVLMLSGLVALLTFNRMHWYHTPHSKSIFAKQ
jgi:cellulose synthase/poly-beta-1,6-N-acetylglucosamine synthase-like glycosyltransferase